MRSQSKNMHFATISASLLSLLLTHELVLASENSTLERMEPCILLIGGYQHPATFEFFCPWNSSANRVSFTNLLTPRWAHSSEVLADGRILTAGGISLSNYEHMSTVEFFNPKTEMAQHGDSMAIQRKHAGVARFGDYVHVCGGGNTFKDGHSCERYRWWDWETVTNMTEPRSEFALVAAKGKLYAIGGTNGHSYLSSMEVYDEWHDIWHRRRPMATPRHGHAAAVIGQDIYVCGGYGYGLDKCEIYNTEHDYWGSIASMNKKRFGFSLLAMKGYLFAIGGSDEASDSVEMYDPESGKWTLLNEKLIQQRYKAAGVVVEDDPSFTYGEPQGKWWVGLVVVGCLFGVIFVAIALVWFCSKYRHNAEWRSRYEEARKSAPAEETFL